LDRQTTELREWVESWFKEVEPVHWLTPEEWFTKGQIEDFCIWTPPPAAADAAIEQLAKATHKRPH